MIEIIPQIKELLSTQEEEVNRWFEQKFKATPPFFYNSVDIRHSGYKIAPVDTNLFPGGFNNLSEKDRICAIEKTKQYFKRHLNGATSVLLVAEDHTRNLFYLENIAVLHQLLTGAGLTVWISSLAVTESGEAQTLTSQSGIELHYVPLKRVGDDIQTIAGDIPEMVLINNDLTVGAPEILQNIRQPVLPPLGFGWYRRRKTSHFDTYNDLVREFANHFGLDSWLLSTYFHRCGVVNFKEKSGLECVAIGVDKTIHRIQKKYDEYGIDQQPYVFIKSDKGTYGMGIMTATSGQDVMEMGKKIRNKMNTEMQKVKRHIKNS